jgi:hypothetical protein
MTRPRKYASIAVAAGALLIGAIAVPAASGASGSTNCGGDATTPQGQIFVRGTSCATGRAVVKVYKKNLGQSTQTIKGFTCTMLPSGNISRVKCVNGDKRINWSAALD